MRFVCPRLDVWVSLYSDARNVWEKAGSLGIPPPSPPTMDMWASLSDDDKEHEWACMFSWLEQHEAEEWANFPDCDWYVVGAEYIDQPTASAHSPYGRDPLLDV